MGKIMCLVCENPLHYSKENVCGGHGDFYNKYVVKCRKCNICCSIDNYYSSRNERLDDFYFELLNEEYRIKTEPIKKHIDIVAKFKQKEPALYKQLFGE